MNQRGQTSYTGGGYGIDRWIRYSSDGITTLNEGYMSLVGNGANLDQILEGDIYKYLRGKEVTLSILARGNVAIISEDFANSYSAAYLQSETFTVVSKTITVRSDANRFIYHVQPQDGDPNDIIAVKLELGSQQTLAHQENGQWVLNEIPDYGEQLLKCQRYYRSLFKPNVDYAVPATAIAEGVLHLDYALNPTMRTSPVLVGDTHGALRIVAYNVNDLSVAIAEPCDYIDLATNGTSVDRSTLKIVPNSGVSLVGRYCFTVDTFGISAQFGLSADL